MWHDEAWIVNNRTTEKDQIEIERAWRASERPLAAALRLNRQKRVEQGSR